MTFTIHAFDSIVATGERRPRPAARYRNPIPPSLPRSQAENGERRAKGLVSKLPTTPMRRCAAVRRATILPSGSPAVSAVAIRPEPRRPRPAGPGPPPSRSFSHPISSEHQLGHFPILSKAKRTPGEQNYEFQCSNEGEILPSGRSRTFGRA